MYAEGLLSGSGQKRVLLPNGEQRHSDNDVEREPQPSKPHCRPRHRRPALVAFSNLGDGDVAEDDGERARNERGD